MTQKVVDFFFALRASSKKKFTFEVISELLTCTHPDS